MHHRPKVFLLTVLATLVITASATSCAGGSSGTTSSGTTSSNASDSGGYPLTVTDSLGRRVEIGREPERMVSVAPSVTETLFAVGAGDRVVGVTTADDYPKQVEGIETVGDAFQVNAEKVASLDTDVLFLSFDSTTKETARDLQRKTGAKVVVINPTTVDEAIQSVGEVGRVAGEPEKGRVVEERLTSELEGIESRIEGDPEPTVFYELGYDPLYTIGPGSFVNDALDLAGGENVVGKEAGAYPQYSTERLLQDDPEVYLVGSGSGSSVEDVESRAAYDSLRAVRDDKVFVVEDALISRPGPRIVEGIRDVAKTLHPEAFEE